MTALLAASLFFTNPAPLEMPRAEAYFVREAATSRLEDRFARLDLWTSRAVDGRWIDDDGRVFLLATLAERPPLVESWTTETRSAYVAASLPVNRRKLEQVREAIEPLVSVELPEKGRPPARSMPRGYKDVDYWQGTNTDVVVCAFLPEESDVWRLATWTLAEGDDFEERVKTFEDEFLRKEFPAFAKVQAEAAKKAAKGDDDGRRREEPSEADLLRGDARHSVAAYERWHATDAGTYEILDDLPRSQRFVASLTNELPRLHAAYAAALPTPLDGTNVLCVARVYASREEYLDALATDGKTNMAWSAAYWSPLRRELVAYLPFGGEAELMRTIRHEAFHQYLSYATAMMPTSPWLNEGYAQFFEDPEARDWQLPLELTPETLKALADDLPALFGMDYEAFYAGTDLERLTKYRLAWSVAVFLEKGAPKVRFDPFKNLKHDYFEALFETQDPRRATAAAFKKADDLKLFQSEWRRWWSERLGSQKGD